MLLNLYFLVVLSHRFFSYKTFRIPIKVDADTNDTYVGLNYNSQEPEETNTNEVHNDQHAT